MFGCCRSFHWFFFNNIDGVLFRTNLGIPYVVSVVVVAIVLFFGFFVDNICCRRIGVVDDDGHVESLVVSDLVVVSIGHTLGTPFWIPGPVPVVLGVAVCPKVVLL